MVATPACFDEHPVPQHPADLTLHACINFRLATHGEIYAWEFHKDDEVLSVRVKGQLAFNSLQLMTRAVLAGHGLACLPETAVRDAVDAGALIQVLDDWSPDYPGYHLYYPNRRNHPAAFTRFLAFLRTALEKTPHP